MKRLSRNFSGSLKRGSAGKKVNSHPAATEAKATIRRNILAEIGLAKASVFDAFAGQGEMFQRVWKDAKGGYVGCDLTWYRDDRDAFVADNRIVLRSIDLSGFNIFDIDAWGNPWEQALIIAARRPIKPKERIGLAITEGNGLSLRFGNMAHTLAQLAGIKGKLTGANRGQDDILEMAVHGLCVRMKAAPLKMWRAKGRASASMRYIGLILEGRKN